MASTQTQLLRTVTDEVRQKPLVNGSVNMGNKGSSVPMSEAPDARACVPKAVPSITELKKVLPPHCFQPSVAKSLYYVAKDLAIIALLYLSVTTLEGLIPGLKYVFLPVYWYLQGTMMWAVFVLGHDCGHGSFSHSTLLNDVMGNLLHGFIMVPYYPWKLSHQHHHKNTGNIDKDEIFYPVRKGDYKDHGKDLPPFFLLGASWFFYLVKGYSPRAVNHLNPFDPLLVRRAMQCAISLASCAIMVGLVLFPYTKAFGWAAMINHYLLPLLVFASWLVITTFLHHQDENVPWYADHEWDFVKGNLSSVDRDYGWAHGLVHNIGTHQIHHLFSKIPHYYLEDATAVFRAKYPHLVRKSNAPILSDFAKMFYLFNQQQWIEDDTEIHIYSSKRKVK